MNVIVTLGFYSPSPEKLADIQNDHSALIEYSVKEIQAGQQKNLPPYVHKLHGEAQSNSTDRKELAINMEECIGRILNCYQTAMNRADNATKPYWSLGVLFDVNETVTCTLPLTKNVLQKLSSIEADLEICYYPCSD